MAIHDAGQSDGTCYLVSDYVSGATLADRLAAGKFSFREAAELLSQVADASSMPTSTASSTATSSRRTS